VQFWRLLFGLILLTLAGSGCGRSNAQVSGKAQFSDGSPLTGEVRVIRFEPTADSPAEVRKSAFADIEPDGTFQMMTRQYGDGVIPGKYHVTFTVFKTAMGQESAIPKRYTAAELTPFSIEVSGDVQDLRYELEKE
jgi:hypothetical protein